jgi:Sulfotransferase domain
MKVFLDLRSGVTRGAVPDVEQYEVENMRNVKRWIREQKETLEAKNREIFRLKNELRAAKEGVEDAPTNRPVSWTTGKPEAGALPDFFIIGTAKGGTNSLYNLLTRHPHVEPAALKGLQYFSKHFDQGVEWYRGQFPPPRWKDGRRSSTGEATPRYLYHPLVPERMAEVVPQARLIALLRNPVDRTYSHYHERVSDMRETRSFEEAIEAEKEWMSGKEDGPPEHEPRGGVERPTFPYLEMGIYVDQLLRWSKFFSNEQMLVLKSEDFFERELDTLKVVLDFLDLPDWEPEEAPKIHNKGHYKQKMDPAIRQWLEDYFKPHNRRLYEYLGVDFGW